ncbi:MAG: glycosyltransferase family 4 protein [Rhodobacteraceae bacterium]|nr:glycosyltransferase family 4 protein [Paracoccaceae bacterium]MCW9044003.1 glycosyltransferase family 4 protein [Pseudopelagicola sp.]
MKIIQITPYSMDRPGGVQTHIRDLCAWLEAEGHETRIIAPPGHGPSAPNVIPLGRARDISVHGTRFELTRAGRAEIAATVDTLRAWGGDVVHLHTPWTPLLPWQVWRALSLPSVATFHATLPEGGRDPLAWALGKAADYFNARLSRIVVPSRAPLAQWQNRGANPLPAILPPTIDLSEWRAAHRDMPLRLEAPQIVYMGRLEDRKGVQVLLEAWPKVVTALPRATLTIAGSGALEEELRTKAAPYPSVRFLPPPDATAARALIADADVFVAPALGGESFGLVLIEAMSAGTVPIAAQNAGYASVLDGDGTALLVPPGDAMALAERIISLAENPDEHARLRAWCAKRAAAFDVKSVGPQYLALYTSALA